MEFPYNLFQLIQKRFKMINSYSHMNDQFFLDLVKNTPNKTELEEELYNRLLDSQDSFDILYQEKSDMEDSFNEQIAGLEITIDEKDNKISDMEMEFQLMDDKIAELKEMLYELNDRLNQKAWSR